MRHHRRAIPAPALALAVLVGGFMIVGAWAQGVRDIARVDAQVGAGASKSLAILIGVQGYPTAPLKYCLRDVHQLETILRDTCKYDRVVGLTDGAPQPQYWPTLGNLTRALRDWLSYANNGNNERVVETVARLPGPI